MTFESQIQLGVLGAANIAQKNIIALLLAKEPIQFYALASRNQEKAEAFLKSVRQKAKIFTSYDDLIEDPKVDALYIPLPSKLHFQYIEKAVAFKKHILVEKPISGDMEETIKIHEIFLKNTSLQYMDGTMWLHNVRTLKLRQMLYKEVDDNIGDIQQVNAVFTVPGNLQAEDFFDNDIRVRKDLEALGALGDQGWYSVGVSLFGFKYDEPIAVQAAPGFKLNNEGNVMSCHATILYKDDKRAQVECSYLTVIRQFVEFVGSQGTISLNDYVVPQDEFNLQYTKTYDFKFQPPWYQSEHYEVNSDRPQETRMWEEFAKNIQNIKKGENANTTWLDISILTNRVLLAIQQSIEKNCQLVNIKY